MASAQFCPVTRLEKLLVATDRSEFSEGAITEAISFAKKCSSKVYVMSVMETNPEYETIGPKAYEEEESEAVRHLESVKERAKQEGLDCEAILVSGNEPHELIVNEAAKRKVDMIIIGRHGRKGLLRLLMGQVAAKVIGNAPCKVLVVPKSARIQYRNILIATDGSKHSEAAAAEGLSIAKRCGSSVIALSSARSDDEREEAKANVTRLLEMARKEEVPAEALTPKGKSHDAIVETASGRGIDLIVMGSYGKTGIGKLLMGSSTEKVVGNAGCAVLVVKSL